MNLLIFTEGTILMHRHALGHSREEVIQQVKEKETSVHDYASYVPINNAAEKLRKWKNEDLKIFYLTSRRISKKIWQIRKVLVNFQFPDGRLVFR